MRHRSRVSLLAAAIAVAVAGPWTGARADDWPAPGGDPFAGVGVVAADVSMTSNGALGLRVTLPTPGAIDLLGWIDPDPAGAAPDDMVAIGGYRWNVLATDRRPSLFQFAASGGDEAVRIDSGGDHIVDQRGSAGERWLGLGAGSSNVPAGTYDMVIWAATSAPTTTTRFRVRLPADATVDYQTSTDAAFLRTLRQFTGTASATVEQSAVVAAAAVGESTSVDVTHQFFGEFVQGRADQSTVPYGHYTAPDGTHNTYGQTFLNRQPSGAYTFTIDNTAYANPGGVQPFVTGVDLAMP